MPVATLIAVRPVIIDGQTLPPGSVFTVPEEHAAALLHTGEAAASHQAAASYTAIYPLPARGPGHRSTGPASPDCPARPDRVVWLGPSDAPLSSSPGSRSEMAGRW